MGQSRPLMTAMQPWLDAASHAITLEMLEAELSRRPIMDLAFAAALESRFDREGRRERTKNIILNLIVGILMTSIFGLLSPFLLPDLNPGLIWAPLGGLTLGGALIVQLCRRRSARLREALLALLMVAVVIVVAGWVAISTAPLALHVMMNVLLVSMFGNITLRLRFRWACLFSLVTFLAVIWLVLRHAEHRLAIRLDVVYATFTCIIFGLIANNQLERFARRSFLHALMETLRADQLLADREIFSALSLVDALTGLANRRAFDLRLAELVRRYHASGDPFALLIGDIDHFKLYNDHYGHPAGDACLAQVGLLLRQTGRSQDLVARYGGEEFAVLLPGCETAHAARVGQAICNAVAGAAIAHLGRRDGTAVVTISLGIATTAGGGRSTAEMIAGADRHLYAAKRAGRNRIHFEAQDVAQRSTAPASRTSSNAGPV